VIRLWFLLNSLAPYGAETFVLNHATHADRSRFEVTVCQIGGATTLAERFANVGVRVVNLEARRRLDPRALWKLVAHLRREDVDILQTHIGFASVFGRVAGVLGNVGHVVSTEQTVRDDRDYGRALRRAMRVTYPMADAHVFISEAVRQSFHGDGPVIPNGIDARRIAEIAEIDGRQVRYELGLRPEDFVFGCVARLTSRKGQALAIEALPRGAKLVLVGDGEDRASLKTLATRLGRTDDVHFTGQRLDVPAVLGALDAYVHPALVEGLGIAVLEAMAVGLPVIASATGGIPEFVRDGETGWLVPPGDVGALTAAMARAAREPNAAMANAGQALVAEKFDIRTSVAAYEALYVNIHGRKTH
jgi:glycosyltransferase involved in cell wall biosynthesis